MKKKVFLIPLAMFMVTGTVGLAACDTVEREEPTQPADDTKTLVGIAVDTPPTKTVYTDGDSFDPTGLKIKASYTDGTSEIVDGWTVDKTQLAVGDNVVTISYTKGTVTLTTTVAITVNPKVDPGTKTLTGIAVTTQPTKTHYDVGEVFDKAGMVVTASYSNSDTADVTEHVTTDKDGVPLTADDKVVTVSYTEGELTVTAKVNITVGGEPTPPGPEHAGTLEDPLTTAEAVTIANGLAETTDSKNPIASEGMYVKGVVTEFKETFSAEYGNYSIVIGGDFTLWRIKNGPEFAKFNAGDIEVGDEVTAFVYIMNFKGTPESTSNSYVHSVQKAGDTKTLQSIEIVGSLTKTSYVEGQTYSSAGLSVKGHYDDGSEGDVAATITLNKTTAALGDTEIIASATFKEMTAEPKTFTVTVTEKVPVVGGAVYTFTNDKEDTQNMGTWTSDQFMNHISVEGAEIITGMKGVTNAYIGGNGGSGDGAWNIWNCLKVGKSSAKGEITLLLDGTANFEKIKVSAIGARDDGTLTINNITKNVTKKAIKTDLNPIELEYEIAGGVTELKLSSKDAASNNYGICITRIEFVGEAAPVTLESITADMTNKEYTAGQALNLAGLTVTGHYSNGTTAVITEGIETSMAEGKILETTDTKLVVSVGELDCEIPLTVRAADVTLVSISLSGVKESYYAGDLLGEVVVTAHYSDESSSTVSAELKIGDAVVDATHVMALGESKLVATYQGKNAEAEFIVVEDTVVSIAVSSEHRSFNVGAEFVKETVTATYKSGATKDVTAEASFTGHDLSKDGVQTVTVTYGELEPITYTITVTKVEAIVAEGTYLISATVEGTTYYMQENGANAPKAVTKADDATPFIFTLVKGTTDQYNIKTAAGDYLYCLADNNGVRVGKTEFVWIIEEGLSTLTGAYNLKQTTALKENETARYLSLYNGSDFRCYNTANASNRKANTDLTAYVQKTLESISVTSEPKTKSYYVGETFNPDGLVVKAHYVWDAGSEDKEITDYELSVSGAFVAGDVGEKTITVTFGGKTATFVVTVEERTATLESVTIGGTAQTEYVVGAKYNHDGLTATANYSDGGTLDVTELAEWSISKETAEKDDKSITITAEYEGVSGTKDVAVTISEKSDPVTVDVSMKGLNSLTTSGYVANTSSDIKDVGSVTFHRFNPATGAIGGNKTTIVDGSSSDTSNANFHAFNTTALTKSLTKVVISTTISGTEKFQNNLYLVYGDSQLGGITAVPTTGYVKGTVTASSITFDLSKIGSFKYFKICSKEKFTSGTVANVVISFTVE